MYIYTGWAMHANEDNVHGNGTDLHLSVVMVTRHDSTPLCQVCMCTYIHTYIYTHIQTRHDSTPLCQVCMCKYKHTYLHTYIHRHDMIAHLCMCMYVCMCVCVCVRAPV